ncbi:MAG: hypothetical protein JWO28_1907 [Hyphomicrobiales bacterium]|nr:hypothetical protein [Hyphomicrobiales bacterium]
MSIFGWSRTLGRIGTAGRTHPHTGIGSSLAGDGTTLRIENCQARSPFQVADEGRSKFGIVRQPNFIGGIEHQRNPSLALNFGQMTPEMPADHAGMRPARCGVRRFISENYRDERRDVFSVMRIHAGEHRSEDRILRHFFLEASREALNVGQSAAPVQQSRYRLSSHPYPEKNSSTRAPGHAPSGTIFEGRLFRRTGRRVEQFLAFHLIRADRLLPLGRNQPVCKHLGGGQLCVAMLLRI